MIVQKVIIIIIEVFIEFINQTKLIENQNSITQMIRHPTQPVILNVDKPRKQQHYLAKSSLMNDILHGGSVSQPNNHFIDSLQRFKKDYAVYDKQARQFQRQKRLKILEERKNQQIQRESRMRRNQLQYDQKNMEKINQSRYLCQLGLKKTGFTNGMPMNPITLQYHQNPFGHQQKYTDQEEKLRKLVRAHHIQNASTCGYNPINGTGLPTLDPLVPKNTEGRLQQKLGQFYQTKRLDPNVDLGLNPKNTLPKYVGQVERGNQSPIKTHKWQQDEPGFQSAYQSHFNEKPHEIMTKSRMQQSNLYKQYMQPMQMGTKGQSIYDPVQNYQGKQSNVRQNNENINPYMQDTAFQSQLYEMRK